MAICQAFLNGDDTARNSSVDTAALGAPCGSAPTFATKIFSDAGSNSIGAHHKSDALYPLYARLLPPKQGSSLWMPANCRP
ncbi:hypothetical protein MPLSOD_40645 [Mesorhizobium sp. SOD10]|nr:hypothetical protein MPLSOD_40645 [Mesorhizobium sp. SOD10]